MQDYILTVRDYEAKNRTLSSIENFAVTDILNIESTLSFRFKCNVETHKLIQDQMKEDIVWLEKFNRPTLCLSAFKQDAGALQSQVAQIENLPDGSNVDIVILDAGDVLKDFEIFSDRTRPCDHCSDAYESRVKYTDWNIRTDVPDIFTSSYGHQVYFDLDSSHDHPTMVACIAAGNDMGWSKKSSIYSLDINQTLYNGLYLAPQMIRNWHLSKPVNSSTGYRNPTVVIMSFSLGQAKPVFVGTGMNASGIAAYGLLNKVGVSGVSYRGVVYPLDSSVSDIPTYLHSKKINFTLSTDRNGTSPLNRINTQDTFGDITQAQKTLFRTMADTANIFCVSSAGNNRATVVNSGHADFSNKIISWDGTEAYYNRARTPQDISKVFSIGSIGSDKERTVAEHSNIGPNVDLYAPGEDIIVFKGKNQSGDDYTSSDTMGKSFGTSFATPQVGGMIACYLSNNNHNASYAAVSGWLMSHAQPMLKPSYDTIPAEKQNDSIKTDSSSFNRAAHYPGLKVSLPSKNPVLHNPSHSDVIVNRGETQEIIAVPATYSFTSPDQSYMIDATQSALVVASSGRFFMGSANSDVVRNGMFTSYPSGLGLGKRHYLIFDKDNNPDVVYQVMQASLEVDTKFLGAGSPHPSSVMGMYFKYTDDNNFLASQVTTSGIFYKTRLYACSGGVESTLHSTPYRSYAPATHRGAFVQSMYHINTGTSEYYRHILNRSNKLGQTNSVSPLVDSAWITVSAANSPPNGKPGLFVESHDQNQPNPLISSFSNVLLNDDTQKL